MQVDLEYKDESSENSRATTRQAQRCGHGIGENGAKKWKPVNRQGEPIEIRGDKGFLATNRTITAKSPFLQADPINSNDYSYQI